MRYLKAQKVPRISIYLGVTKHGAADPAQAGIQKGEQHLEDSYLKKKKKKSNHPTLFITTAKIHIQAIQNNVPYVVMQISKSAYCKESQVPASAELQNYYTLLTFLLSLVRK